MKIIKDNLEDIVVFQFVGSLETNTAEEAELALNLELDNQPKKMIFDLGKTDFVSSAGLRIFLIAAKKLAATGGKLKLCSANDYVKDILEISGFITILDLKNNLDEAKNDF